MLARLALRQAETIRDLQQRNRSLAEALQTANDTSEELARFCRGWKSRAEALFLVSDPDLRDGIVAALNDIDMLLEKDN